MEQHTLTIPNEIISPTDIARLLRETESLDEFFRQSTIRQGGTPQSAPRYSRLLDGVVVANELNLLQGADRELLIADMKELSKNAPVLHISFSVDPPGAYVQKIVTWLRSNIDGRILVRVGLQPNIGAGCVVRTTNKSFDFSLRRFFDSKKEFFTQKLHEVVSEDATPIKTVANTNEQDREVQAKAQNETVVSQESEEHIVAVNSGVQSVDERTEPTQVAATQAPQNIEVTS